MANEHQLVVLTKTDDTAGPLRTGTKQETKHPIDQPRTAAIARAYALLKRSNPAENPMCWTASDG